MPTRSATAATTDRRWLKLLAATGLVVLAILAGCGGGNGDGGGGDAGDGGVPPKQWASDVCGALGAWLTDLQGREGQIQSELEGVTDLGEIKTILVDFLDDAVNETEAMIDEVEAAGTPDVDRGEELRRDFVMGIGQARTAFQNAKNTADNLSTDDQQSFTEGAQKIEDQLDADSEAIQDTFNTLDTKYDVPELDEAFDDDPECRDFTS
jgi:hypothetical protein